MANLIPLGGYTPLPTFVHRTDARIKLFVLLAFSICVFTLDTWEGISVFALMIAFFVNAAEMPSKAVVRGVKPTLVILVFMLLANGLSLHAVYPLVGTFGIDPNGMLLGLFFVIRIVLLVAATLIVTFTTSHAQLTEALTWLLGFLRPLKVPVDDLVTMLSIALRFIPTTMEEFDRIAMAQRARGAKFDQGNPLVRLKAWIPVFIPLFVSLFKRSVDLANAMDSRCYRGKGRTVMSIRPIPRKELVLGAGLLVMIVVIGVAF